MVTTAMPCLLLLVTVHRHGRGSAGGAPGVSGVAAGVGFDPGPRRRTPAEPDGDARIPLLNSQTCGTRCSADQEDRSTTRAATDWRTAVVLPILVLGGLATRIAEEGAAAGGSLWLVSLAWRAH